MEEKRKVNREILSRHQEQLSCARIREFLVQVSDFSDVKSRIPCLLCPSTTKSGSRRELFKVASPKET